MRLITSTIPNKLIDTYLMTGEQCFKALENAASLMSRNASPSARDGDLVERPKNPRLRQYKSRLQS